MLRERHAHAKQTNRSLSAMNLQNETPRDCMLIERHEPATSKPLQKIEEIERYKHVVRYL